MSERILLGGREYVVPRSVTAEGDDAREAWFARELVTGCPAKALSRMSRSELEDEAARLGLRAEDDEGQPYFDVVAADGELTNGDFIRTIKARRTDLRMLVPEAPAAEETDGEA